MPGAGVQDLDALQVWAHVPAKHKLTWRGKPRYLLFAGESQKVLEPFLQRPAKAYCFSPAEAVAWLRAEQSEQAKKRPGYVGNHKRPAAVRTRIRFGERYTKDAYATAIRRACKRAGVPPFPPYALRHLAAAQVNPGRHRRPHCVA